MADQEVKYISIKDLVLWTENPRDPISRSATDQEIVNKALKDKKSKWNLAKLAKEMGDYYDYSELPTVVYHKNKPIVYDGNRRIILGKIKHGLASMEYRKDIYIPDFPEEIPCNVCTKKIGLNNVYRKHSESGSWQPLERDIFLHKFMGKEKSTFLILEEDTGIISKNPHLNQRFVKDEIFKEENLKRMGLHIKNGRLNSTHNDQDTKAVLSDISLKIERKQITTRKNRGKVIEVLEPSSQKLIEKNKNNQPHVVNSNSKNTAPPKNKVKRQSKRTKKVKPELFGGKLYLTIGDVSNLYRDVVDLHQYYTEKKSSLSHTFPSLIRMSLRLLCETAAKDKDKKLDTYLKGAFKEAKEGLDQDAKTTLANHNITEQSIIQLLHTGAHSYQSSSNIEQTIALSTIIGSILTVSHGK